MTRELRLVAGHTRMDDVGAISLAESQTNWRIVGPSPRTIPGLGMHGLASALGAEESLTVDWRPEPHRFGQVALALRGPGKRAPKERIASLMAAAMPDLSFEMAQRDLPRPKETCHTALRPGFRRVANGKAYLARLDPHAGLAQAAAVLAPYGLRGIELRFTLRLLPDHMRGLLQSVVQSAEPYDDGALANFWLVESRGIAVRALAHTDAPLDEGVAELARAALFGPGGEIGARGTPSLDLSDAWPAAAAWPRLLPDRSLRGAPASAGKRRKRRPPGSLMLGRDDHGQDVFLAAEGRPQHTYIVGAPGTGKSTLMANSILQDAESGEGVILLDPHGDLAHRIKAMLPAKRREDLVWADIADPSTAIGINILESAGGDPATEREFVANELISFFKQVLYRGVPEAFGPVFELYFRNTLLLLIAGGDPPSLKDFTRVLTDRSLRRELIKRANDPNLENFWINVAEKTHGDTGLENFVPYIASKLTQFTDNKIVARMLDPATTPLDLPAIMRERKIAVVSLEKGSIGGFNAAFIGALLAIRIAQTAMARAKLPEADRTPCRLYIDEFQTLAGASLSETLAESRKYGLSLTLANQSLTQIGGAQAGVGAAALANCANIVAFRVGVADAQILSHWFTPEIEAVDLTRLANYTAAIRRLDGRALAPPTRLHTLGPNERRR
jgi:hypothetical protein